MNEFETKLLMLLEKQLKAETERNEILTKIHNDLDSIRSTLHRTM